MRGLAIVAFLESSIFPIPPDVMLVPMVLARPHAPGGSPPCATVASVVGGLAGYAIGYFLFETVGHWIIELYGLGDQVAGLPGDLGRVGLVDHPDQGADADPLQAGDHRQRPGPVQPAVFVAGLDR